MVGIDISDRSIKVAEVAHSDHPELRAVCWSALKPSLMRRGVIQNVAAVAEAVRGAFDRCLPVPVSGRTVVASIPETQSFVRVLDLPPIPEQEVNEAIQWAVREHLPFDLERVYLDWQSLVVAADRRQVVVGAAQRDVVDPLLEVFDTLDLTVAALELEAQAVVRCLLPLDPDVARDVRGVLVVDLGATSTNVIFFDRGSMRFTASVQRGGDDLTTQLSQQLGITPEAAAELKAVAGTPGSGNDKALGVLRMATLELVRSIERVVREMTVALPSDQQVSTIMLSGGNANLVGISEIFAEVFSDIPVHLGNPWANLPNDDSPTNVQLSSGDALHFATALGLALRRSDVFF